MKLSQQYFITGGAGFIGCNYVDRLLRRGESVTVYDNLSRMGAGRNLEWLRLVHGEKSLRFIQGDVRDADLLASSLQGADADVVIHLASQVAVTTSVLEPRHDFECNAWGTFNVLEAARLAKKQPLVIYASTNKVYGNMESTRISEDPTRYRYTDLPYGVDETQPLDFHSPYGCSKGAGDQYTRDYFRIYGLPTVVLRQSCIYGPRQFGVEDQGWVAWFLIAAVTGRPVTIYGNGKQVRDILFIEDLLDVYDAAAAHREQAAGQVYNIGGGPENTLSVWHEFGPLLEEHLGQPLPVEWSDWRPGDQQVFVADIRKAGRELGFHPQTSVRQGIFRLFYWVSQNRFLFK